MKYPEEIKMLIAHCSFPPVFVDDVRTALENNLGLPADVEIFQPSEHRSSRNQCERKMGDYWPKELTREKVETFLANRGRKSLGLLLATIPVLDLAKKRIPKGVQIISLGADIYTQLEVLPDAFWPIFKENKVQCDQDGLRQNWRQIKLAILRWLNARFYAQQQAKENSQISFFFEEERKTIRALYAKYSKPQA